MRNLLALVCLLVLAGGCGRVPLGSLPAGDYKLYEATTQHQQIAVIDSRSHATERNLPLGTPSSDWQHLYSVTSNSLIDTDPVTGATLHTLTLPGRYQLPRATLSGIPGGLSQNGHWLTVQSGDPASALPAATHMVVIDTTYSSAPRRVDFDGVFNFDAVSNDGQRLYLIEYVNNSAPTAIYRVRLYDLATGTLDPNVIFDKSDGSDAMAGLRLAGVPSPDGNWLYSMYVRENQNPFIHALSLDGNVAFCIDLPGAGYSNGDSDFHWSLALNSNGLRLYAVNAASGVVNEYDTSNGFPVLLRSVHINLIGPTAGLFGQDVQAKELGANGAVLSPDGRTLVAAGSSGVTWIETSTLQSRGTALNGWTVSSLASSPDGKTLYALSDAGKVAEMSMPGRNVMATFDPGTAQPLALIRVEGAAAP